MSAEPKLSPTERAEKQKRNFCPFHCPLDDLNDNGYCHHLQGFTNDGVIYERIGKMREHDAVFHEKNPKKRARVLPGDILINPEEEQNILGVRHTAKRWASSRVYRDVPKPTPIEEEAVSDDTVSAAPPAAPDRITLLEQKFDRLLGLLERGAKKKRTRKPKESAPPQATS